VLDREILEEVGHVFAQVEIGIVADGVEEFPEGVGVVAGDETLAAAQAGTIWRSHPLVHGSSSARCGPGAPWS